MLTRPTKYIAVQTGARRGYAVPMLLDSAGMLERFYTDIAGNVGLGAVLTFFRPLIQKSSLLLRLASRKIPPQIKNRTWTFGRTWAREFWTRVTGKSDPASRFQQQLQQDQHWGQQMIQAGYGEATHVYSMLGEGSPFLLEARRRGLMVVVEVYILLATEKILQAERQNFPDWEPPAPDFHELRVSCGYDSTVAHLGDCFICPSPAVQEDLVTQWNIPRERTVIVPYGMNPSWLAMPPKPQRGRVLFVGTADLRKGIHYLAMASAKLAAEGKHYEFRVAGNVTDQVRHHPACRHLTFLGRVPRDRIQEEFATADVFVLPSLAEGSAEVTYEALASGLPIVTTPAAGSVARDGIDGIIIRERDVDGLAAALSRIIEDRPLRMQMAAAARQQAQEYTWEKYGERLLEVLRDLRPMPS